LNTAEGSEQAAKAAVAASEGERLEQALLRKAATRTRDILWDKIGDALRAFTPQEYANYFKHAENAPR
jgi:hypothetical protein